VSLKNSIHPRKFYSTAFLFLFFLDGVYEIKEGGTTSVTTLYPSKILRTCNEILTHFIKALVHSHYLNHFPLYELDRSLSGFLYTYIFWMDLVRGIVSITRIPYAITWTLPTVLDEVAFFGHHSIQTDSDYPNYRPLLELDGSLPGILYTYIFWLDLVQGIVSVTRIPYSITSTVPTVLDEVVFFGHHLIYLVQ